MISWFNRSRIRSYVKLSTRKQNKMKQEIDERFAEQRSIMDSRLANAKDYARKADRLHSRGKEEKAKVNLVGFTGLPENLAGLMKFPAKIGTQTTVMIGVKAVQAGKITQQKHKVRRQVV